MGFAEQPDVKPGRANPGRIAAARVLVDVEAGDHAEELLAARAPRQAEDRGLAWHLVLGVLRGRARVDAALRQVVSRPIGELDPPVRAVLRMGAFEALVGGTPRHAVVDQAVEVARVLGAGRASGLVNAALRRVALPNDLSRADALDHPAWLVSRWDARYGEAATTAWCKANGEPPPLVLAVRGTESTFAEQLLEAGVGTSPARAAGEVVPGLLRVEGRVGRVEALPGFAEGAFWVQDAASAWMADLVPESAKNVIDACAAPGGKTFRLISKGHTVLAVDGSEERLNKVRDSLRRLRMEATVRPHDWLTGRLLAVGEVDAVLVDAPCTALGVLRRHPEIRWRRSPLDPKGAAVRQFAILAASSQHVRSGGALVYAVCSPEPEEGPQVVQRFLKENPEFTLDVERTTAPPQHDEDAFYGARMVRR